MEEDGGEGRGPPAQTHLKRYNLSSTGEGYLATDGCVRLFSW